MNVSLAQAIALVTYGNLFLRTGKLEPGFFPANSTFQECRSIDFQEVRAVPTTGLMRRDLFAGNPILWLSRIRQEGCLRLSLHHIHIRTTSELSEITGQVFAAGNWLIQAKYQNEAFDWCSQWNYIQKPKDLKPGYVVTYLNELNKESAKIPTYSLLQSRNFLIESLNEVIDFADRQKIHQWKNIYLNSKEELISGKFKTPLFYKDIIPMNINNIDAKNLLIGAEKSSYFGGMGTWNDMYFESREIQNRYHAVSEKLFLAICQSICSATDNLFD